MRLLIRWFKEYYMIFVPLIAVVALVVGLSAIGKSSSISVPVQYCKAQYTGQTRVSDYPIQSCAAYDKNMNCTVPITTWVSETQHETRMTCDWLEWR